ncbi:MAG: glycosyltransferase [Cyanobacteria bacterium J06639_14]
MKVLHLSTWKEVCGIAEYTKNLVQALNGLGIENEVFPIRRRDMRYMSLEEMEAHFTFFCDQAQGFDVVHIQHEHGFFCGPHPFHNAIPFFGRILSRLEKNRGQRIIVTFHTEPVLADPNYIRGLPLKDKLLERTKAAYLTWKWHRHIGRHFQKKSRQQFQGIVHSKQSRLKMLESGFAPERLSVIEHGFPVRKRLQHSTEAQTDAKRALGIPEHAAVMSIFGFVSTYKGYDVAIRALARLPEHCYLIIAGGPHPEADPGEKTIQDVLALIEHLEEEEEFEISHRILVTGFVPFEMLDTIHMATDICLAPYLPSTISASGALSWALSSGKPTIASKISAFRELNETAQCLLMFQPVAPLELAWQILNLLEDENLQHELVERAAAYVEKYSWDAIARRVSYLYKPE